MNLNYENFANIRLLLIKYKYNSFNFTFEFYQI